MWAPPQLVKYCRMTSSGRFTSCYHLTRLTRLSLYATTSVHLTGRRSLVSGRMGGGLDGNTMIVSVLSLRCVANWCLSQATVYRVLLVLIGRALKISLIAQVGKFFFRPQIVC